MLWLRLHQGALSAGEYLINTSQITINSQKFRAVCTWWLQQNPVQIGGVGVIAEIDESLMSRRKYNVGMIRRERWVFGGLYIRQVLSKFTSI